MKKEVKFYYVYVITNLILNKQYVGSKICYKDDINDNYMGSSKYLNEDYKRYGKENFKKEILEKNYKNIKDMLQGETEYILKYHTLFPNGYNRFLPNKRYGFHTNGIKHTEETKQKMRKPHKKLSEETKQKMSNSHKGKKLSFESIKKRIDKIKGKKRNKTNFKWMHNNKISLMVYATDIETYINDGYIFGRLYSNETRNKMSFSRIGKHHTEETKRKQRESKLGNKNPFFNKTHSQETKERFKNRIPWNKGLKLKIA